MPELRNLKVAEVSFCRKGMNQHAKVALFKSADDSPQAIAKATFQEALDAQLVSQRVQNAFYGCFDNLWSRNDAFRTAMTDELAAGGDGSVAADAWVASVKELADNAVAAAKENGGKPTDAELSGAMDKAVAQYLSKQETTDMTITTLAALKAAITKFDPMKDSVAHRDEIVKAATDLKAESELPAAGPLAKAAAPTDGDELAKAMREISILKMPGDVRKHFDTLGADDQTAFLAKSAEDQATEVAKRNEGDPVVYKCADGTEIRKSDGAAAAVLAKRLDAMEKANATLTENIGKASIEKQAAAYPNVATNVAVTMLKSAETADDATKAAIIESLTAMNKANARHFVAKGSTGGTEGTGLAILKDDNGSDINEADAELDLLAKAAQTEHGGDYYKAYDAIMKTAKGRELYAKSQGVAA